MTDQFHDIDRPLSATLTQTAASVTGETLSVRELLGLVGEQGMLIFCVFLIIPFLVPVSVPGISTVFGLLIVLIGIGVTLNRVPWLPSRLMDRRVPASALRSAFEKGAGLLRKLERFLHPRWLALTRPGAMNRFNGLMLVLAGVLLMAPFGFVPFSNTLPGIAVLFLALGLLQRDGVFILLGYVAIVATIVYFGFLIGAAVLGGMKLKEIFSR